MRHPGVADRRVHHRLLIAALVEGHRLGAGLQQRLADAGDIAVPEDAPHPGDRPVPHPVPLGELHRQEADQCLRDGEPHEPSSRAGDSYNGSRGSGSWPAQLSRTHACAGSSLISQDREGPGPAITLR